ncbi:HD domain-containing protein [Occallatibacter savannae]|uniref:HD domain-containing protein n=1 Tax=Occallatibacter savannae TaxID=1002691 RepID=UPI000D688CFB|nr:HD domain-containing protein [Occallatibacter savannae]
MQAIIDFIREVDRLKSVERKTKPLGLERYENSAEHSWQLAVMVLSLSRFSAVPIDELRTIKMLLLHDIGEIDTGDTIVYATAIREEKKGEERAAVERICGMLPEEVGAEFLGLWLEFEAGETAEAKFAHAMDRTIPIILNLANNGQSWRENGIRYEQVIQRNGPAAEAGCPALWAYLKEKLDEAQRVGWFGNN